MNITTTQFLAYHDEILPLEDSSPEALAQCTAPLHDEARHALRKHWDRMVWEEWIPPAERVERVPSFAELDERRAQRRMRRLSAAATDATRTAQGSKACTGPDAA